MPQTIFPISPPVTIASPPLTYAWTDIDLSALIPVGATGAIVYIWNPEAGVRAWGIRQNGSTDGFIGDMSGGCHCYGMIGVDASRRIEFNNAHGVFAAGCGAALLGYTMPGVTFFVNGVGIALSPPPAWDVVDLSVYGVPSNAIGAIFRVWTSAGAGWQFRMHGSADSWVNSATNWGNQFGAICGCDGIQRVDIYRNFVGAAYYLLGYVTDGATFHQDAIDVTPGVLGAWTLCPNPLPRNSVMAFVEMANILAAAGLWTYPTPGYLMNVIRKTFAFAPPDANGRLIGYVTNAGDIFRLTGYGHLTVPTVQTDPATEIT